MAAMTAVNFRSETGKRPGGRGGFGNYARALEFLDNQQGHPRGPLTACHGPQQAGFAPIAEEVAMAKVLVLYYSSYGHIERMAAAEAEGARGAGAQVDIKRVPELVPRSVAEVSHYKLDQAAPIAHVDELPEYDAVIFGTPTRFGNMAAQMKNFIDQTGSLWMKDRLVGKVGSVFTATATQHGGQEATILSFHIVLLHLGFIVVGLPYTFKGQTGITQVHGGTPYGASTITGGDGLRMPSAVEIEAARYQGRHVAAIADGCGRARAAPAGVRVAASA
jgi:NAD(P)H dehydrogenase (quinone)